LADLHFSDTAIYDEIYGYIPLTELELKLVNHRLFQRLNYVKQLGAAYRVFPGAQHTRFSHSLGVMCIIDRMMSALVLQNKISTEERQKLRVAALLHDIGHYPFSHVIEAVMTEQNTKSERKHEKLGAFIIANSSIKDILAANTIDPLEIGQIITGESPEPLYNQLMSSELDADRIDYLLRDAVHTGVAYGRFDLNRLIHTLTVDKNSQLCVEKSGMHAVEGYVIGRYLMWAVVYTHRVINAFELLLDRIYQQHIGEVLPSYDQIKKLVHKDEPTFAGFTDATLLSLILEKDADNPAAELCQMFIDRTVLEVAMEAQEISADGRGERKYFLLDEYKKQKKVKEIAQAAKIPEEWVFHNSSRAKLPNLKPLFELVPEEVDEQKKEMSKGIRILYKDGKSAPLANDSSSLVYYLRNMSLDQVRIYTQSQYRESLKNALDRELGV
jgi:HD superfamily phosphohydrolase